MKVKFGWNALNLVVKWSLVLLLLSIATGSSVAFFLLLLDVVTHIHFSNNWLLFLLPIAGVFIFFVYQYAGKNATKGTGLVLSKISHDDTQVPARMAPLVLLTTIITHLFGGSAGREGTAVQIGAGITSLLARWFTFSAIEVKLLLMVGMSAGFAAVFGTPVTAVIFVIEIIAARQLAYKAILPCLIVAFAADYVCSVWGIHHTVYTISAIPSSQFYFDFFGFDCALFLKSAAAGVVFGMVGGLFIFLSHSLKHIAARVVANQWLHPVIGGVVIIGLTYLLDTRDYLGLGVMGQLENSITIVSAFSENGATAFSWFWKLVFTVVTLSLGFKGGEVTPLFYIGATLGNTLALTLGAPVDLVAGLGFVAVFAAATNAPIACAVMAIELFGIAHWPYYAIACLVAYWLSGPHSIYKAEGLEGWMQRTFTLGKRVG